MKSCTEAFRQYSSSFAHRKSASYLKKPKNQLTRNHQDSRDQIAKVKTIKNFNYLRIICKKLIEKFANKSFERQNADFQH